MNDPAPAPCPNCAAKAAGDAQPIRLATPVERRHDTALNVKDLKKWGMNIAAVVGVVLPSHATNGGKIDALQAQTAKAAADAEAARLASVRLEGKVDTLTALLTQRERARQAQQVPTDIVPPHP